MILYGLDTTYKIDMSVAESHYGSMTRPIPREQCFAFLRRQA